MEERVGESRRMGEEGEEEEGEEEGEGEGEGEGERGGGEGGGMEGRWGEEGGGGASEVGRRRDRRALFGQLEALASA